MTKKIALITGVTGQDGAYLAKFLISKNYTVYGSYRRTSTLNFWRLEYLNILNNNNLKLIECDITDLSNCLSIINQYKPCEIYNLAAQSYVGLSFNQPILTSNITALGVLNMLEAVRIVDKSIKYYQASSSEMFGKVQNIPQDELTNFYPRSPYGIAKLYGHWMTVNYRESYGMYCVSGILFNHESPIRGLEFVTRKITDAVSKILYNKISHLELGNIDAIRDWGFAEDYVEGMWLMMQKEISDTYILATNTPRKVRDFITLVFNEVNIDIVYENTGINEIGINRVNGKIILKINENFYRPSEVDLLLGDASKASRELGWKSKTSFNQLCKLMIDADLIRNK